MTAPRCPSCETALAAVERDGATIETCRAHGLWLSHDVFDRLLRRAHGEGRTGQNRRLREAERAGRELRPMRAPRARPAPAEPLPDEHPPGRACPQCAAPMVSQESVDVWKQSAMVVVDRCAEHGIWLDRGELEALLERERANSRRVVDHRVRRRYREAREPVRTEPEAEAAQFGIALAGMLAFMD